jgi:hypothetical protein
MSSKWSFYSSGHSEVTVTGYCTNHLITTRLVSGRDGDASCGKVRRDSSICHGNCRLRYAASVAFGGGCGTSRRTAMTGSGLWGFGTVAVLGFAGRVVLLRIRAPLATMCAPRSPTPTELFPRRCSRFVAKAQVEFDSKKRIFNEFIFAISHRAISHKHERRERNAA